MRQPIVAFKFNHIHTRYDELDYSYDTWGASYKFNSKELDAETGLYYYGARYYSPWGNIWLSVDQKSDDYPHQSPYMFCSGNPVMRVDMDGMNDGWVEDPSNPNKGVYWDPKVNSQKEAKDAGVTYHGQEGTGYNEKTGGLIHYKPDGTSNESFNTLAPTTIYGLSGSGSVVRAMEKSMNQGYDPNWINSFSNCYMLSDYLALSINGNAFLGGGFGGNLSLGWVKGDGGFLNASFSQGVGVDISWGMGISFGNYIGDDKPTAKLLAGPFSYQNMGTVANITTFQDISSNNSKLRIGDFWQGGSLNFSFGSKTVWGGSVGTSLTSKPLKLW